MRDALGHDMLDFGSLGQLPLVTVVSGPGAGAVATALPTGYRFDSLALGTYTIRVAQQNGASGCFVPTQFTISVTAADVSNGQTSLVHDVALQRQVGTIMIVLEEAQPEGGSRLRSGQIQIVATEWGAVSNVGKTAVSVNAHGNNYKIPNVTCDSVRLHVTPSQGATPFDKDRVGFYSFGHWDYCETNDLCSDLTIRY